MNYAEELYQKIWTTKGARFNAHKRLEDMNQLSNGAIALNSIYVIVLSLLAIKPFSNYSRFTPEYLSLLTITFSMIIIVLALIENSKNHKAKADSLHNCAKALNKEYERIKQIKEQYETNPTLKKEIEDIGMKYQDILDKCPDNHSTKDYELFLYSENDLFKNKAGSFFVRLWIKLSVRLVYYAAIIIPLLLLCFLIKLSPTIA